MFSPRCSRSTAIRRNSIGYRFIRLFSTCSSFPCNLPLIRIPQVKGSAHRTGHIGYTFSPALPVQPDEKILEIDFLPVNAQRLISSTARVSEESDQGRKPMPSQFLWLPTEEEFQLSCRIRRQDDLRLFHLRNFERRARPLQVGVN